MALSPVDARAFHDECRVIDLHADTPKLMASFGFDLSIRHERPLPRFANYVGHVDIPRMHDGGVAAQIFGMWTVPFPERGCAAGIHKQLDAVDRSLLEHADKLARCFGPDDVAQAQAAGQISVMTGIEGAHALEGKIENVEIFAKRGVRYIGLLHFSRNKLGAPAKGKGADPNAGLTDFGRDVIAEMNRLGVVVDLAHINRKGFFDALDVTKDPMMVTHTGVSGVYEHWRNIDDEQLRAVADRGGCVGIIFAPRFLGGKDVEAVADHLMHIVNVCGEDLPALGSDYDGFVIPPRGLEDISMLPSLTAALSARGLPESALKKLLGDNALRVLGDVMPKPPNA